MLERIDQTLVADESHLGMRISELTDRGGLHTAIEIAQQPALWLETWKLLSVRQKEISRFLDQAFQEKDLEIMLTGAGTSAYIGTILQGYFQKNTGKCTTAVPTTDLLSHPELYLGDKILLLISFARSGNSPESVAGVNLANLFCKKVFHLIITCNPESELVSVIKNKSACVVFMPPKAEDQGLAMTSSFTSMLLSGLLISRIRQVAELKSQVEKLAAYGERLLKKYTAQLREIARLDFDRAIFLGSGPMQGAAKESDLKLQELTAGKVICKFDSFLGFRHGPKILISPSTLLVYLFSNNSYVQQYERDLVQAINAGDRGLFRLGIAETADNSLNLDLMIELSDNKDKLDEELLPVCSVLPAQLIGFFKSMELGLKPDNSSENGTITRVVQGVTIYPFNSENK